ncbi:MGMT family protein [Lysinibacter cavernae]|uniref:Alkylated DNA nucleotide flippase Atl1 n=1 Tax=Lysinibacter cavernae TaxID=1640652 RepID=A0A7X5R1G9_9MICO|nr:alkylated DNA nucleotide flippase Atl1 [Lysinibacter cavernae]
MAEAQQPSASTDEQTSDDFIAAVLDVVSQIPEGHVMSYGGVAASLGSRAARQVGKIMAYYGSTVPWWRVIRSDGYAPEGHDERALEHYEAEGTPLLPTASGRVRVNMRLAQLRP